MREKDYCFVLFKRVKLLKFCDQIKYIIYMYTRIYLSILSKRSATKYDDDKPVQIHTLVRQSACT